MRFWFVPSRIRKVLCVDLFRDVYENSLHRFGFTQVQQQEREGHLFVLDSPIAQGHYWVYAHHNLFAVSEIELTLHEDFPMDFEQPADIQIIAQYESSSGVTFRGNRRIRPTDIREYLPRGSGYQVLYGGGKHVRGTSILLQPAFCEEYLQRKYPGEFPKMQTLFHDTPLLPEISRVMRDIKNYHSTGLSAKLYYESKVLEVLSLLLRQTQEKGPAVSYTDLLCMEKIRAYIHANYVSMLPIERLARLACMSPTKFKTVFKAATGFPVARYVTQTRMEKAAELLRETDLPVAEIAHRVGYKKAGAFADAYRAFTGYLPSETRTRGAQ